MEATTDPYLVRCRYLIEEHLGWGPPDEWTTADYEDLSERIAEETDIEMSGSAYRWIIDPIDGTVNFAHDLPFVAVSIGLEIQGELEIGVVYNPDLNEFFHARKA